MPALKVRHIRRAMLPQWLRGAGRHKARIAGGVALAALGGGGAWAWHTGLAAVARDVAMRAAADAAVAAQVVAGLVVNDVTVEGPNEVAAADLLRALGVQRGDLLLGFDAGAARRRIEDLGWVRTAMVSRRLPDRIHVDVTERAPFALWQNERRLLLIDRDGAVITDRGLGRFSSLPMVVGADAAPLAGTLLDVLAQQPALRARMRAAVRVGGRRWDIHFDNGVIAKLPEAGIATAWTRLAQLDAEHRVLDRTLLAIDLRLADRLVLRLEPPPPKPTPVPKAPPRARGA